MFTLWMRGLFLFLCLTSIAYAQEDFVDAESLDVDKPAFWVTIEVGSPYYNFILEAHVREVPLRWETDVVKQSVHDVEMGLRYEELGEIVTGEYFQVHRDTGAVRRLMDLQPYLLHETEGLGMLFVYITQDLFYYLPMDIADDMIHAISPFETTEDLLPISDLLYQQLKNITLDLRTASGITLERNMIGDSGLAKIGVSIMTFSPSGVLHGVWDFTVGIGGAVEDVVFGSIIIVRRGFREFAIRIWDYWF
jgi:hypothetical protein